MINTLNRVHWIEEAREQRRRYFVSTTKWGTDKIFRVYSTVHSLNEGRDFIHIYTVISRRTKCRVDVDESRLTEVILYEVRHQITDPTPWPKSFYTLDLSVRTKGSVECTECSLFLFSFLHRGFLPKSLRSFLGHLRRIHQLYLFTYDSFGFYF